MNDIVLNSDYLVSTNTNDLQHGLVIRTKSSEKALQTMRKVAIGLIKPEDEKYLTGELKDKEMMVTKVVYTFSDIKQTVEARIDENGNLFFNTENAALATKDAVVRIICLVCTHLECIKSAPINIHLHPIKGYIKAKDTQKIDMQFGDELEPVNIANLYTVGNPPSSTPSNDDENKKIQK